MPPNWALARSPSTTPTSTAQPLPKTSSPPSPDHGRAAPGSRPGSPPTTPATAPPRTCLPLQSFTVRALIIQADVCRVPTWHRAGRGSRVSAWRRTTRGEGVRAGPSGRRPDRPVTLAVRTAARTSVATSSSHGGHISTRSGSAGTQSGDHEYLIYRFGGDASDVGMRPDMCHHQWWQRRHRAIFPADPCR